MMKNFVRLVMLVVALLFSPMIIHCKSIKYYNYIQNCDFLVSIFNDNGNQFEIQYKIDTACSCESVFDFGLIDTNNVKAAKGVYINNVVYNLPYIPYLNYRVPLGVVKSKRKNYTLYKISLFLCSSLRSMDIVDLHLLIYKNKKIKIISVQSVSYDYTK